MPVEDAHLLLSAWGYEKWLVERNESLPKS
jgi:hypothetical protein